MLQGKQRTIYAYICISIVLCFGVVFILNKAQKNWNWGLSNLSDNTISKMERYINNNPNDLEAMHELVLQYMNREANYTKADKLLCTILNLAPDDKLAIRRRATVMSEQFQFDKAIVLLEELYEMNKDNPTTLYFISRIYLLSNQEKALEYAQKALEVEERLKEDGSEENHITFYDQWVSTVENFEDNLKKDPIGTALTIMEQIPDKSISLKIGELALSENANINDDKVTELLEKMGLIYTSLGINDKAAKMYWQIININPEGGKAYLLLADRAFALNNLEIIDVINKKIELQENLVHEKEIIACIVEYNEKQTIDSAEKLRDFETSEYEIFIYNIMGMMYEKLGKLKESIKYYEKVLSISDTPHVEYWINVEPEVRRAISSIKNND